MIRAHNHNENPASFDKMMKLPEDAVLEILLRLPVRSLLRFRCVCKEWFALIKSSLFKDRHLGLRRARAAGVDEFMVVKHTFGRGGGKYGTRRYKSFVTCCYGDYESLALSVSAKSSKKDLYVSGDYSGQLLFVNHVNGVVCVAGLGYGRRLYVTLLNPSLREVRKLPYLGFECFMQGIGFGYDEATNEYKVVAIVTLCDVARKHIGVVYNLNTDSWKILGDMSAFIPECYVSEPNFMCWPNCCRCIFLNGSIHWCIGWLGPKHWILAFNMTNELFQEIPFPPGWKDYESGVRPSLFVVDKSTMALVALTGPGWRQELDVWVMKEYGVRDSWSKQYSIRPSPLIRKPLSYWRKDHLILLQTVVSEELICYGLKEDKLYQPGKSNPIFVPNSEAWSVEFLNCIQSLVSIKSF